MQADSRTRRLPIHHHEHVKGAEEHGLDGEKVAGEDGSSLSSQKLAPSRTASTRRRRHQMPPQQGTDRGRGDAVAQLEQLALNPPIAPEGILPSQPEDYVLQLSRDRGPAAAGSLAEGSPAPARQLAMPAQEGGRREEQAGRRQVAADGGQDQAITRGQFRTLDLATEDGQLMTQGQELEFALLLRFSSHQEEGDQEAQARIDGSVEHGGGR